MYSEDQVAAALRKVEWNGATVLDMTRGADYVWPLLQNGRADLCRDAFHALLRGAKPERIERARHAYIKALVRATMRSHAQ